MSKAGQSLDDFLERAWAKDGAPPPNPISCSCSLPLGGEIVDGYQIGRQLGRGGQGCVFAAKSLDDSRRKVAIKFYESHGDDQVNGLAKKRFLAEAEILKKLDHPQLPRCFGTGTYNGNPYYVMERLEAFPVHRIPAFDDGENDEPLAEFLLELLDVVEYLHRRGIVHQDIKPQNICMKNGKPALIDLGLVYDKSMVTYTPAERLAILMRASGGSYGFCAPEQVCGMQMDITVRADIFAIGSLINTCMRGWDLPLFKQIAAKCLNVHPAYRYKDVGALRFAIANRHRLATVDVALWGVNEANRQVALADREAPPVKRKFGDFLVESCKYYDRVMTNHGLQHQCAVFGQGKRVIWYPLIAHQGTVIVEDTWRFDRPAVIHLMGFGAVEMSLTGSSKVVVVLDRGVRLVNRAAGSDSDEAYFINEGCELVLPNVCDQGAWKMRHRVFESIHNRPMVSFGREDRESFADTVELEWKRFVAKHRPLAKILNNICSLDDGIPPLDISLAGLRK